MRLVPCALVVWFAAAAAVAQHGSATKDLSRERSLLAHCWIEEPSQPPAPPPPEALPVPEPSTLLLVGTGLVGLALTARRRRKTD